MKVWMSHGDRVEELPPGFVALASTANSPIATLGDQARKLYGLQFHPEVVHTPHGGEIIRKRPWPESASKWARSASSAPCPAAWIPR